MVRMLRRLGVTPDIAYYSAVGSIALSLGLWFVPRSGDDGGRAERLAIFVGLWPPTLMVVGHALREEERDDLVQPGE